MCEGGARGARRAGTAGEDDDEAGVRLPETLHLRRRLRLRLGGIRLGAAGAQARTGNSTRTHRDREEQHTGFQWMCSYTHTLLPWELRLLIYDCN